MKNLELWTRVKTCNRMLHAGIVNSDVVELRNRLTKEMFAAMALESKRAYEAFDIYISRNG